MSHPLSMEMLVFGTHIWSKQNKGIKEKGEGKKSCPISSKMKEGQTSFEDSI